MKSIDFTDEYNLLNELKCRSPEAFSWFCKKYSKDLLIIAYTKFGDASLASERVEELLIGLWRDNKFEEITVPIHRYLFKELHDLCRSKAG